MKRLHLLLLATIGVLALAGCSTSFISPANSEKARAKVEAVNITAEHQPNQIVVAYKDQNALDRLLNALGGGEVIGTIEEAHAALIELPNSLDAAHALGRLSSKKVEGILLAQPNYLHPLPQPVNGSVVQSLSLNDSLEAQKWDHDVMQAEAAWATDVDGAGTTPDGSGVVVGIVDTGIDGTHPDLYGAFVNGYDATGCLNLANDIIPPNYDASTGQIHGTHVAGIVAARGNNGQGVAGVAYKASLMDLKVFCGSYTDDWTIADAILAAINDVDGDGIVPNVITMSLGGKGYGWIAKYAIDAALQLNVAITVAMGNSYQDEVEYPAGYPGIIAVGATSANDEKADFSTSGAHISVSAPGVDILSTWPTWDTDSSGNPYLYYRISGTSMATPEVAGAVALVKQFLPNATAYEIKRLLESTADDIGPAGFDNGTGYGRINLKKLVDKVHDVLAGTASLEQGGTAIVTVSTANIYDADNDGTLGSAGDTPLPLPAADVTLVKGGKVAYVAKTDPYGMAMFTSVAPGNYKVMVAGQDITDNIGIAYWPQERVSWDADGDPSNGITLGDLTINAGPDNNIAAPDVVNASLDSTLKVTLEWTGGGDLDLAIYEYDPSTSSYVWSTVKNPALWGSFSADDTGSDVTHAAETYTLNATHYPGEWYDISIDATNATAGTTATLTIEINGRTFSYGPIVVTPGSSPDANDWTIFDILTEAGQNFDNWPAIY